MSALSGMFLRMAASGQQPITKSTPDRQIEVKPKLCKGKCGSIYTPHIRRQGYYECAWCLSKIYDRPVSEDQDHD